MFQSLNRDRGLSNPWCGPWGAPASLLFQSLNRDRGLSNTMTILINFSHPLFQSLNRDRGLSNIASDQATIWAGDRFQSLNRDRGLSNPWIGPGSRRMATGFNPSIGIGGFQTPRASTLALSRAWFQSLNRDRGLSNLGRWLN